jgi:predicted secreted protein
MRISLWSKLMSFSLVRIKPVIVVLLIIFASFARAEDKTHYNRVQFTAQAGVDVANDMLVARLTAQRKGKKLSQLADEVNQVVTRAIQQSKKVAGVEVQTLGYDTSPIYEKRHQTGWRVSQSIQLRSHDASVLGKLIGVLQESMLLSDMGYQVSPGLRNKTEKTLIGKAIAEFRQRAEMITRKLGHKRYRLVKMQLATGGISATPIRVQRYQALDAARVAPPTIQAGKQRLTVTASGVIEVE